jgi:hypothetical protein
MDRIRTGVITSDTAETLNQTIRTVEILDNIQGAAPVWVLRDSSGVVVGIDDNGGFFAKITGSFGTTYSWTEQDPAAGGATVDKEGGRVGSLTNQPAYELNSVQNIKTGTIVRLYPWYFDPSYGQTFAFLAPNAVTQRVVSDVQCLNGQILVSYVNVVCAVATPA